MSKELEVQNEVLPEVTQEVKTTATSLTVGSVEDQVFGAKAQVLTSFDIDTEEGSDKAFNLMNEADHGVGDTLGTTIMLKDVMIHPVQFQDDQTGELIEGYRCVLIDADGTSYGATSKGLFNALSQFFAIKGHPNTWSEPKPIRVVEKKGRRGFKFYTIQIVTK